MASCSTVTTFPDMRALKFLRIEAREQVRHDEADRGGEVAEQDDEVLERRDLARDEKRGDRDEHERLVGDRVEEGAEPGGLMAAGEPAVEHVGERRGANQGDAHGRLLAGQKRGGEREARGREEIGQGENAEGGARRKLHGRRECLPAHW